mmetsp:Transcript_55558/g.172412  ORF Transcript_55558/g.172412 Transcript_55558/m.172412 type:complete len:221 (-) Transcript_55558:691-1353(-)
MSCVERAVSVCSASTSRSMSRSQCQRSQWISSTSLDWASPRAAMTPSTNSSSSRTPDSSKSRTSKRSSARRTSTPTSCRKRMTSCWPRACRNSSLVSVPLPSVSPMRKIARTVSVDFRMHSVTCFSCASWWFTEFSSVLSTMTATTTFMTAKVVTMMKRAKKGLMYHRMSAVATMSTQSSTVSTWKSEKRLRATVPKSSWASGSWGSEWPTVRVRKMLQM